MEKRKVRTIYAVILICSICIGALIISLSYILKSAAQPETRWVLSSYGNNVALYNENEVVEVYGSISIENLPVGDRERLKRGIVFRSREEARTAVEDYDG